MVSQLRFTSSDLELMPEDGKRYEIIDGELYVSKAPRLEHQHACGNIWKSLDEWSRYTPRGQAFLNPGIIFAEDDDVIPDLAWVSRERLKAIRGEDGHFHGAPELVVEVLSPGGANELRDRDAKLKLYSRRGVKEYWIVNWAERQVEIYRRRGRGLSLRSVLRASDTITSPLLAGFACSVSQFFDEFLS